MEVPFKQFVHEVENEIAVQFERDFFSPLSGRIFIQLIFAVEPISLQELADNIGVSKAAVSIQARLLEKVGLCRRISKPNDRRDYYCIQENFSEKVLTMMLAKMKQTLTELDRIMDRFPPESDLDRDDIATYQAGKQRLHEMRLMQSMIWERLSDMEEVWQSTKNQRDLKFYEA